MFDDVCSQQQCRQERIQSMEADWVDTISSRLSHFERCSNRCTNNGRSNRLPNMSRYCRLLVVPVLSQIVFVALLQVCVYMCLHFTLYLQLMILSLHKYKITKENILHAKTGTETGYYCFGFLLFILLLFFWNLFYLALVHWVESFCDITMHQLSFSA